MLGGTLKISITKSAAITIVAGRRGAPGGGGGVDVLLFSNIKDTPRFSKRNYGAIKPLNVDVHMIAAVAGRCSSERYIDGFAVSLHERFNYFYMLRKAALGVT